MKISLTFVFLLIIFLTSAQDYRITYKMLYKADSTQLEKYAKLMLLDINNSNEKFYSERMPENDLTLDKEAELGISNNRKIFDYNHTIYKDTENNILYKYHALSFGNVYKTKEEIPHFDWKMTPELKKIGSYQCQKAILNYKNRIWEAWFTPEISLQKGPYIFSGLPGLIIYMYDTKNNFVFEFMSLKKDKYTKFIENKGIEVSVKQLNKLYLDYYNNPIKELVKVKLEGSFGDEKLPNLNEMVKRKRVQIKQYNNPIELFDAIKYPQN